MDHEHSQLPSFWRSPAGLALLVAIAVFKKDGSARPVGSH